MATQNDARRIALALPGTSEVQGRFAFSVQNRDKPRQFIWVWQERIDPKKARVPNPAVLAVRVVDLVEKDVVLALDRKKFFTEPHYAGFPAVLVRLPLIKTAELRQLVTAAWRCIAPRALLDQLDGSGPAPRKSPAKRKPRAR